MINLTTADNALKSVYLDVVTEQLNNSISPFLAAIEKSTNDVWGKEVKRLATFGINGGVGAGTEDGNLPAARGNNYAQIVSTLKNLYGTIEISDKAIRASENNAGAFVSLLDAEMEGLLKASKFNFGRMLFGDGTGVLTEVVAFAGTMVQVEDCKNLVEGMTVEFRDNKGNLIESNKKILSVDRANKMLTMQEFIEVELSGTKMYVQGSYKNEITGLGAIFNPSSGYIYGFEKEGNSWIVPTITTDVGEISELKIQTALDNIEEVSGSMPNLIICSWGVRRALQSVLSQNRRSIDTMELAGGFKAMSYNGIPVVVDRFCPEGNMYLLNTNDFTLHQLCDWQWLEGDDGRVLKQIPGKPVYTATLVKYAELICTRPCGQGLLTGITVA